MADGVAQWRYNDRVVVVSGAGTPRGSAQAVAFATAGATVLACDADSEALGALVASAGPGRAIVGAVVDLDDERSVADLAQRVTTDFGRLDVVVVNDPALRDASLLDVGDDEWSQLISNSLTAGFLCAKHLIPPMIPARYGKFVFTTGPETGLGVARRAHACAARHAVLGLARDLAIEVAEHQINVNVATGPGENVFGGAADSDLTTLTHTVLWLASDAARFVTGSVVRTDRESRTPAFPRALDSIAG